MQVQMKVMAGALAVMLSGGALAQGSGQTELRAIAQAAGMNVCEVQMLLSNSPTAYTTWYLTYDVSARKLRRAVQEGRVQLRPSQNGAGVDFAAWQKAPDRGLVLDATTTVARIDSHAH